MSSGDADGFANHLLAFFEYRIGGFADVLGSHGRELLRARGEGYRQLAVSALLWTHAEVNEVFPIEGSDEKGRRHSELSEDRIRFAFGVEVRDLVLLHQRRHPVIGERN